MSTIAPFLPRPIPDDSTLLIAVLEEIFSDIEATLNDLRDAVINGTGSTVDFGDWTIEESATDLVFSYLGTPKVKFTTAGEIVAIDDVTAFGTI